ncbi:MAG: spore protease YyaC [Syntrophomonadaceae bacterium]|nr:spore protease YyaC [Syntrophomonadaceae bacterium]
MQIPGYRNVADNSIHYEDSNSISFISTQIYRLLLEMNQDYSRPLVFMPIGTDRATGDCLGPLAGTRLKGLHSGALVYGCLERPTHAVNLLDILQDINGRHNNALIVAIDACLGNASRVGYINVKPGKLKPGSALNKDLPEVGDFYISGVVNVGGFLEQQVLQNTRLHVVYSMADIIARSLYLALIRFERQVGTQASVGIN